MLKSPSCRCPFQGNHLCDKVNIVVSVASPTFPDERKQFIRNHCDASLNIDSQLMEHLRGEAPTADIDVPGETDYAMLIYTSGSTGTPKGILHDHKSLYVNGVRMFDTYDLTPNDRFAAGIPPYFVAEIYYWKLICGTHIDVNHIIFDGTSLQIFCRDIDRAYRGEPIEEEDWTLAQMAAEAEALRKGEAFRKARDWFSGIPRSRGAGR